MIINNKEVIKEDAFKGISVTAEKWINMTEVKENELLSYLIMKKNTGYKVKSN